MAAGSVYRGSFHGLTPRFGVACDSCSQMDDFDDWYGRAYLQLFPAIAGALGSVDHGADALAEAFTKAFEHWDRVESLDNREGWVYRVAVNHHRRRVPRRARERELLASVAAPEPLGAEPTALAELVELLGGLPDRMREVVVLRYVADFTEPQVAEVLGISRGTVSSTLRDAHRRLAPELGVGSEEARP